MALSDLLERKYDSVMLDTFLPMGSQVDRIGGPDEEQTVFEEVASHLGQRRFDTLYGPVDGDVSKEDDVERTPFGEGRGGEVDSLEAGQRAEGFIDHHRAIEIGEIIIISLQAMAYRPGAITSATSPADTLSIEVPSNDSRFRGRVGAVYIGQDRRRRPGFFTGGTAGA